MIRPAMQAWYEVTKKLMVLSNVSSEDERDEAIQGINKHLDEREYLLAHILAPFTPEEEVFSKKLIALESEMRSKLKDFSTKIRHDITNAQAKKNNMKNYVNPYGSVAKDGAYYDAKQ